MIVPVKRWTVLAIPRLRAARDETNKTAQSEEHLEKGPRLLESFERMLGAQADLMFRNLDR